MGILRKINKQMAGKPLMMADTGMVFNGCRVLLAVNNPQESSLAVKFANFMKFLTYRSNQVNMGDLLMGQKEILGRMSDGRSLLN